MARPTAAVLVLGASSALGVLVVVKGNSHDAAADGLARVLVVKCNSDVGGTAYFVLHPADAGKHQRTCPDTHENTYHQAVVQIQDGLSM